MPILPTNNESPSVFDSLFETLMKKYVGGSAPDASDIAGLMGPLGIAAPLIAKAPLRNKSVRNLVLQELLKSKSLSEPTQKAIEFAAKRHPRITSHLLDVNEITPIQDIESNFTTLALHKGIKPTAGYTSIIDIDPSAVAVHKTNQPLEESIAESIGHELAHAGQYLWNTEKFGPKYTAANILEGYQNNPFEVGARKAGENFKNKMFYPAASKKLKKPEPVLQRPEGAIDRILKLFTGE